MNIAPTVFASRQLINHGHIEVHNKRVTIPSFSVGAAQPLMYIKGLFSQFLLEMIYYIFVQPLK